MLKDALKARIPLISIQTDDLVHLDKVLHASAPASQQLGGEWKNIESKSTVMVTGRFYWTMDEHEASLSNYLKLQKNNCCLVVVNPTKANTLFFDAGFLTTPIELIEEYIESYTKSEYRPKILQALKGLSLKAVSEVISLTSTRVGGLYPQEIRKTRTMLSGTVQGLIPMESEIEEFYQWPIELKNWVDLNQKYFEDLTAPHKLIPRGVLLEGFPGTGKTAAARAVAHRLKIPLYRLDVVQALNRWQGESENRVVRALALADGESPCVILLDEAEKIFTHADEGVVKRIMTSLLWWLADHKSRVLMMMTTNNKSKIPPELYRPGRLDRVVTLPLLSLKDAKQFTSDVYIDVIGAPPSMAIRNRLREAVENTSKAEFSHGDICEIVYSQIKKHNLWVGENNG